MQTKKIARISAAFLLSSLLLMQSANAQSWGQFRAEAVKAESGKDYDQAKSCWQKALDSCKSENDPRYLLSLSGMANCLAQSGNLSEAETTYKKFLALVQAGDLNQDSKDAVAKYAELLEKMNREKDALALRAKYSLTKEQQDVSESQEAKDELKSAKDAKAEAALALEKMKTKWKSDFDSGLKEMQLKHYPAAEAAFNKALASAESAKNDEQASAAMSHETMGKLIELLFAQNKYAQAEPLYLKSLSLTAKISGSQSKEYGNALVSYGLLLRKLNRKREAIAREAQGDKILANYHYHGSSGAAASQTSSEGSSDPAATRSGSLYKRAGAAQRGFNDTVNQLLNQQ